MFGGFALAVYYFRVALAQRPVVVEPGKAEVLERQGLQARHGLIDACVSIFYTVQQFANFFGQLQNMTWDKQGRVMIKEEKLKFARIKSKAVLRGAGDHVEIWAEELWDDKRARAAEKPLTFEDTASALGM